MLSFHCKNPLKPDDYPYEHAMLSNCMSCPRMCGVNRLEGAPGWCRTGAGFPVASVIPHLGEEPVISGLHGICNVFFAHCNLQCIYCQNHQISDHHTGSNYPETDAAGLAGKIESVLATGCHAVGFVSPSHVIPQLRILIKILADHGISVPLVYNTGGYDNHNIIRELEGMISVFLPDMKYMDPALSARYSAAPDYPERAMESLREMYRQKGNTLILDDSGQAVSGLIIRHLVLPGHVENSLAVLRFIAEELSVNVHLSLMSQYHPGGKVRKLSPLGRKVMAGEYNMVVNEMERLGFSRGWIQGMDSPETYLPDFNRDKPFQAAQ